MPALFSVQTDAGDVVDANAYITVDFFKQYFADRNVSVTGLTDPVIQSGIVLATDYIDNRWRLRFAGVPVTQTGFVQVTEWPRSNVADRYGNDIVGLPIQLKKACAEYSLRAARNGQLVADAPLPVVDGEAQPRGAPIETSVTVGPITDTKRYSEGGDSPTSGTITTSGCLLPEIPAADMLIEYLLDETGVQRKAIRN